MVVVSIATQINSGDIQEKVNNIRTIWQSYATASWSEMGSLVYLHTNRDIYDLSRDIKRVIDIQTDLILIEERGLGRLHLIGTPKDENIFLLLKYYLIIADHNY